MASVLQGRATQVGRRPTTRVSTVDDLLGGRLVVYFPDANLCDGAAEAASNGFFDVENTPPWDTWVALGSDPGHDKDPSYGTYLISWVPPQLIALASAGIDVNPEECIVWLENAAIAGRRESSHLIR